MNSVLGQTWDGTGGLILIEGAPGLGKSALINAGCHMAHELGMTVLRARCSEHEMRIPYALARRLLAPSLEFGVDVERDDWMMARSNGANPSEGTGTGDVANTYYALNALLSRFGRVLIAIDDVQWADAESVMWLQYLSRRLDITEVHLLVSMLPRRAGVPFSPIDRLSLEPAAQVFALEPLHESSTVSVMDERLEGLVSPDIARMAHEITTGNPFLLTALINEIARRDSPTSTSDLLHLASPAVMRWTLRRLTGLPPEAHDLLAALAVLGADADIRVAATVANIDVDAAGEIADALADVTVLQRGRPLNFVSALVRSSVYNEISAAKRSAGHMTAAHLLGARGYSTAQVAAHLLETEPQNETWVVAALSAAARDASQSGGIGESLRYLERARVELSPGVDRADFRLALAEIEARFGRVSALDHFRTASQLEHDPVEWVASGLRLIDRFRGSPASAIAVVEMLTAAGSEREMEPRLRLQVELASAVVRSTASAARSLKPWIPQAALTASSASVQAAKLYQALGDAAEPGAITFAESVAVVQANMPFFDSGDIGNWISAEIQLQALTLMVRSGAFSVADPMLIAARQHLRERGHHAQWKAFSILLSQSLSAQGRLVPAEELLGEAMLVELDHDVARHQLLVLATSELGALQSGVVPPLPTWLARDESTFGLFDSTQVTETRGRLCLLSRDWSQALDQFDKAAELAADRGVSNPAVAPWRVGRVEALLGLGRTTEAADMAAENLLLARAYGAPTTTAIALRTSAKTIVGNQRRMLLEEALDVLADTPAEISRCRILIDLGAAHRRGGDATSAREVLRRSADLAVRIGSKTLIAAARLELRAAGARPRRLVLSGSDALTPSERRVVILAAGGHTNSAIADELFVGIKTIESHLARAYRKLGVKSRAELPKVIGAVNGERAPKSASR
jgi:DNA-binding CsgD family transcriptional regulator